MGALCAEIKSGKQMKTRKLHLIILISLLLGLFGMADVAYGQASWTGQKKNTASNPYYVLDANHTLGATCRLEGDLTIKIKHDGTNHYNYTISKSYNGLLFESYGHNLTIEGEEGSVITLDGANMKGDLVRCNGSTGNVVLTYVNLQNAYDITTESGNGRAICVGDSFGKNLTYTHGVIDNCTSINGAAIYIDSKANNTITFTDVEIKNCKAYQGGAIRTAGTTKANMILDNCYIHDNEAVAVDDDAPGYGGGIYWNAGGGVANAACKLTIRGNTRIIDNESPADGAGIFVETAMTIESAIISGNKSGTNGGGICVHTYANPAAGTRPVSISNCTIRKNSAPNGGGLYVAYPAAQTITLGSTVNIKGNTASTGNGGGVYMDSGNLTVSGAKIDSLNNAAGNGGGIYATGGTITVTSSAEINDNTANNGGGIYANGGTVDFSNGSISNNTATNDGGGIYVYSSGTFNISGSATMTGNNVENGQGGGVYQGGTMNANGSLLSVTGNTKGTAKALSNNNVYLPNAKTIAVGTDIGYNSVELGIYTQNDATTSTNIPVLTGDAPTLGNINRAMHGGTSKIKDDKRLHLPYYPASPGNILYFALVEFDYGPFSTVPTNPIMNAEQLYQFMCYVNGVNGYSTPTPGATGTLGADINMSGITKLWIPIGEDNFLAETTPYTGSFNGNGHIVSGLPMTKDSYYYKNYGLFGTTNGATINDVIVTGCNFSKDGDGAMGCIIGNMKNGTLKNSIGAGTLTTSANCIIGGLVGHLEGGSILNCMASEPTMTNGTTMGGLVGTISSGSLKNSFANTSCANGLVGNNGGTVENCYVRGTTGKVGSGSGSVSNCFASTDGSDGDYTAVVKPYEYSLVDNYVRTTNVPLVKTLNNWVDAQGGTDYAHWTRPTTTTINGDYPILKMPGSNAVAASTPNELHYGDINDLLDDEDYDDDGDAIYLYGSKIDVASNSTSSAKLYIDEDAAITQAGAINAYVGVTLKNTQSSATSWDWHMFSPAISNAPLGINYIIGGNDQNTASGPKYGYGVEPPVYNLTGTGYFPTADEADYRKWDYYCYYEPQYHWINFKRNGPSHWHEDAPYGVHDPIDYVSDDGENVNESTMKPGKGYLLATKDETHLQCEGTLNNDDVSIAVTTDGTFRKGYNFIGNPYQSYYDFEDFASDNAALWGGDKTKASYMLLSGNSYTSYTYGASDNKLTAPRCLHPHQGFMIVATNAGTATFDNTKRYINGTSTFRDEQPNYPLVNLIATDAEGKCDITTVELGRPDKGGAVKAYDLHLGKGCLYTRYEGGDYAIAFTQPGLSEVGIRFEADEEAAFTMTWDIENGEFVYLHLLDNMTGADIDCLSATEYRFTATPDDYKSRFKLKFDYTGIEENEEDGPSTGSGTFAFQMGDQLVVNGGPSTGSGTALLQMFDVTGRMMMEKTIAGAQTTTALPDLSTGVYVLLLKGTNGTQTQKIVIEK